MDNQQCCDSFRLTAKGLQSYLNMYLFPNSPPSQAATEPWADVCSLQVLLVIRFKYRSVYVRITHLPALLSPHFPLATTNLFSDFLFSQSAYVLVLSSFRDIHAWLWLAYSLAQDGI